MSKPHNGAHYTPKEVVSILATFRNERHDAKGKHVRRDASISGESFQRAKCLTHSTQNQLRQELRDEIADKKNNKKVKEAMEKAQIIAQNDECEMILRNKLQQQGAQELSLEQATLEIFSKLTCSLLKAFYQVRKG